MKPNICIAGHNRIAVHTLQLAMEHADRFERVFVVANPTDTGVDGWQPSYRRFAEAQGFTFSSLEEMEHQQNLIFFSAEYSQLLKPDRFATDRLYNIHFSLLPAYKGMFTSAHPILNGEKRSGCTIHRIDRGIDTGDIIAQADFSIGPRDTAKMVYAKYLACGIDLIRTTWPKLISGEFDAVVQPAEGSTYYARSSIDYRNLVVDLNQTASGIDRQIRAFNHRTYQLPTVFGRPISSTRIRTIKSTQRPGRIVEDDGKSITVSTVDYDCELVVDRFDALIAAVRANDLTEIEDILDRDEALLNESGKQGWTPLIVAAWGGHDDAMRLLLKRGADPSRGNEKGTTPFMYAKDALVRSGNGACITLLLAAGADPNARDIYGLRAHDYVEGEQLAMLNAAIDGARA